jgi:hypothetical protein
MASKLTLTTPSDSPSDQTKQHNSLETYLKLTISLTFQSIYTKTVLLYSQLMYLIVNK